MDAPSMILGLNQFQLRALRSEIDKQLIAVGGMGAVPPAPAARGARSDFKHGDLIEFTARNGSLVQARINRLNDKSIGCVTTDAARAKWRVSYGLARLVGADKPAPPASMRTMGAASTAAGAGAW
jgi:hypothetical protein